MPDASFVGKALPPTAPYRVGREKIREFALAIGEGASVCLDVDAARAAGHPDVVAPPTFPVVFTMPAIERFLRDPAFGWDYLRMVHGDQSITLHRPIHGGDDLVTTIHVDDLKTRGGSHFLTLRCEVADTSGEPVATTKLLLVTAAEEGA
ncbi:MAG TPA: MaoC family dehydratase N-terminal domain-containing protein [Pseudonocardia sp.]|uniref:FAS1-like dehydratase domain-containing protein n=1 Tax=Pseudonocardia sp. TaxID=60912 RepID=UPI002B4B189D|nr:MaoC family dehydratase N-terminal domain-containing protein [Pseudonocardia sp.]HLU56451.1 MaoC family dehydratase N-terminal domain-containing protein [Pseudonocardia sp.]